jgi:hypothetical protein
MTPHFDSWYERFLYWLGYGDEPLPPEEKPLRAPTPVAIAKLSDQVPLAYFVRAVLNGAEIPFSAGTPPLWGRQWWFNGSEPSLQETDVKEGWERLDEHGDACGLLTWAEVSTLPALAEIFAEVLLKFQYVNTLLAEEDACPLAWGALAYQAAVAAYNTAWLVVMESAGAVGSAVAEVREMLHLWLRSAASLATTRSGDLVLLHSFYNGLDRWRLHWERNVETAQRNCVDAQRRVRDRRREHNEARRVATRCTARSRVQQARIQERQTQHNLECAKKALSELDEVLRRWHSLCPLSRLLKPHASAQDDGVTPMPLSELVVDRHAEGLQQWLIRQMVRCCPLSSVTSSATHEVLRILQAIAPAENAPPRDGTWWARLFLLRFYRLWVLSCPSMEEVERTFSDVTEQQRTQFKAFFTPWVGVQRAHEQIGGRRFLRDDVRHRFNTEYALFWQPLDAEELWQNRLLTTAHDKMQALRDHLLRVLRVQVQTVQGENSHEG